MCYEKSVNIFEQNMRERQKLQCSSMRGSVKGLQRIARQKAPVIKENAKYSFVELGKFNTSLYTRRILKRFWRVHCTNTALGRRCTTMLQPAVDRSLNPFCCSHTHLPPFPSATAAGRLRFYTITEKGAASARPFALCGARLSLDVPIVQSKLRPVTKTQSTALNPFLGLGSSMGFPL